MSAHALKRALTGLDLQREQFILLVVDGMAAGPAWLHTHPQCKSAAVAEAAASRSLRGVKVQARIAELRAERDAAARISVPFLTGELLRDAGLARKLGQLSAAVGALQLIAKMHGFLIDRHQAELIVRAPSASPETPDEMTEAQWLARHAAQPLLEASSQYTVPILGTDDSGAGLLTDADKSETSIQPKEDSEPANEDSRALVEGSSIEDGST